MSSELGNFTTGESHISELVLGHLHGCTGHGGRGCVLSELRGEYWVVQAHSIARRVTSKCVVCRRSRGRTGEQKMADLPQEQLRSDLPPFTNVWIGLFWPAGSETRTKFGQTVWSLVHMHEQQSCTPGGGSLIVYRLVYPCYQTVCMYILYFLINY